MNYYETFYFAMNFTKYDSPVYTLQLIYKTIYNCLIFTSFYLLKLYNKKFLQLS